MQISHPMAITINNGRSEMQRESKHDLAEQSINQITSILPYTNQSKTLFKHGKIFSMIPHYIYHSN